MAAGDVMCSDELLGLILAHDATSSGCALHTLFSRVIEKWALSWTMPQLLNVTNCFVYIEQLALQRKIL